VASMPCSSGTIVESVERPWRCQSVVAKTKKGGLG
jgi:hypothetical protein